ncbi:MAG: DUF2946 family protein [Azoarcus sp.]|nr:DUF2946 family protein [Azoarcus sp.]
MTRREAFVIAGRVAARISLSGAGSPITHIHGYNPPMRPAPFSAILASTCRNRRRHFVWLLMLALCLQLLAAGIARVHALQSLDADGIFAAEICHGLADDGERPGSQTNGAHCPFCRLDHTGIALPAPVALTFPFPEPAALFLPAADAALRPCAPDSRHAPTRAPPFPLA